MWKDDAQIVEARVTKVWMSRPQVAAYTVIGVSTALSLDLMVAGPAATLFRAEELAA